MQCPRCNQPAISFSSWFGVTKAFSTICPNCQVKLKANKVTVGGFILTVLWTVVLWGLAHEYIAIVSHSVIVEKILSFVVFAVLYFVGLAIVFLVGGYTAYYD